MKVFVWSKWLDDIFLGTKPPDGIGGAEVQMALWAKYLAKNGHKVYTLAWRPRLYFKKLYGILFIPLPWIRKIGVLIDPLKYVYFRIYRPDIVVLRSSSDMQRIVNLKKKYGFRLIYMLAHDFDVIPDKANVYHGQNWFELLNEAEVVVAQSAFQAITLQQNISNKTIAIQPNIFDPLFDIKVDIQLFDFIWVGTIKSIKRPDMFIRLANAYPNYRFTMIGVGQDTALFEQVMEADKHLDNFTYLGYLSLNKALQAIARARVLINTSEYEGFPNVFLQSWYFNIPVISTVNPNGVFEEKNLGRFVNTMTELSLAAEELMTNKEAYMKVCCDIKEYFNAMHDPQLAYDRLASYFENKES